MTQPAAEVTSVWPFMTTETPETGRPAALRTFSEKAPEAIVVSPARGTSSVSAVTGLTVPMPGHVTVDVRRTYWPGLPVDGLVQVVRMPAADVHSPLEVTV